MVCLISFLLGMMIETNGISLSPAVATSTVKITDAERMKIDLRFEWHQVTKLNPKNYEKSHSIIIFKFKML